MENKIEPSKYKNDFMTYVTSADPDQPVHPHILIRIYDIR